MSERIYSYDDGHVRDQAEADLRAMGHDPGEWDGEAHGDHYKWAVEWASCRACGLGVVGVAGAYESLMYDVRCGEG